jgi:hypothetical protein
MPRFFLALLVLILAAIGCPAFAEGSTAAGAASADSALLGISRATQVAGGLVGATSVSLPLLFPDSQSVNTAWLWANVGLWTARSVYQAVAPQGAQVRGLSQAMLAGFIATDALFLFSALVSTLHS